MNTLEWAQQVVEQERARRAAILTSSKTPKTTSSQHSSNPALKALETPEEALKQPRKSKLREKPQVRQRAKYHLSQEQIHELCLELHQGQRTIKQIRDEFHVCAKTVRNWYKAALSSLPQKVCPVCKKPIQGAHHNSPTCQGECRKKFDKEYARVWNLEKYGRLNPNRIRRRSPKAIPKHLVLTAMKAIEAKETTPQKVALEHGVNIRTVRRWLESYRAETTR